MRKGDMDELERLGNAAVKEIAATTTLGEVSLKGLIYPLVLEAMRVGAASAEAERDAVAATMLNMRTQRDRYADRAIAAEAVAEIVGQIRALGWMRDPPPRPGSPFAKLFAAYDAMLDAKGEERTDA